MNPLCRAESCAFSPTKNNAFPAARVNKCIMHRRPPPSRDLVPFMDTVVATGRRFVITAAIRAVTMPALYIYYPGFRRRTKDDATEHISDSKYQRTFAYGDRNAFR